MYISFTMCLRILVHAKNDEQCELVSGNAFQMFDVVVLMDMESSISLYTIFI